MMEAIVPAMPTTAVAVAPEPNPPVPPVGAVKVTHAALALGMLLGTTSSP